MEINFPQLNLLTGEIHADFLPITSDRTNFIIDSQEYNSFHKIMRQVLARVLRDIKYWQGQKEKRRIRRVVNDAIEKVKDALKKNPELAALVGLPNIEKEQPSAGEKIKPVRSVRKWKASPAQKRMTAKVLGPSVIITKLKMGQSGFNCQLDHFGAAAPESYAEGSLIYLNDVGLN